MVSMIVSSGMDHQRATFQVCNFKPGRQYRIGGVTHGVHIQSLIPGNSSIFSSDSYFMSGTPDGLISADVQLGVSYLNSSL